MPKYIIDKMVPGVSNKHCLLPFSFFSILLKTWIGNTWLSREPSL